MVFGHEGLGWLCCPVVLIGRLEEVWILYTLYTVCDTIIGGQGQEFEMGWGGTGGRCQTVCTCHSSTSDLFDTHPQPPTLNLLAWHSCLRLQMQGGAEDGSAQVLFHVFLPQACQSVSCLCTPLQSCSGLLSMPSRYFMLLANNT